MSGGIFGDGDQESEEVNEKLGELMGMPPSFFRSDNGTRDSEFRQLSTFKGSEKAAKYVELIAALTPGEMTAQFMQTAPVQVQTAMKETILSLFGSLYGTPAFDSSIVSTQRAIGSLFYQMEMTGYMFRNAEYRQSLEKSLSVALLESSEASQAYTPVQGNVSVRLGQETVTVDAESYVSELRREVESLRSEIAAMKEKEEQAADSKSVVSYIQQLSQEEIKSLSENISPEVIEAMQHLVKTVMRGISGGETLPPLLSAMIGQDVDMVTEVPTGVLAQLCMWQLVVGYNLREIENRENLQNKI